MGCKCLGHVTTASEGRRRGSCVCVCVRACTQKCERVCVCGAACLFTFFLESTIVRRRGDCVYLSLFSSAGGAGEKRGKEKTVIQGILIERILQTRGFLEREKKHSCEMISTVFVITI